MPEQSPGISFLIMIVKPQLRKVIQNLTSVIFNAIEDTIAFAIHIAQWSIVDIARVLATDIVVDVFNGDAV